MAEKGVGSGQPMVQDNTEDDTDVIEANIGKDLMCDDEMLESILNGNDGNQPKGILDDSHEHEEDVNKNKDFIDYKALEYFYYKIFNLGQEVK